jgi:hypothetical protein
VKARAPFGARILARAQECGDGGAKAGDVDEESVVPLRAVERHEVDLGAPRTQALGNLFLLREPRARAELPS